MPAPHFAPPSVDSLSHRASESTVGALGAPELELGDIDLETWLIAIAGSVLLLLVFAALSPRPRSRRR